MVCSEGSDTLLDESGKRVIETISDLSGDGELRLRTKDFSGIADSVAHCYFKDTSTS